MKKITKIISCIFFTMLFALMINPVSADGSLKGDTILTDLFDLTPLTGAHVGHLEVNKDNGEVWNAWCVDPDVLTHIGDVYTWKEGGDGTDNAEIGREVITRWYLYYQNNSLYDTSAGYYAVQMAIWGKIKTYDPINLKTKAGADSALAEQVKNLAHDLYTNDKDITYGTTLYGSENCRNSNSPCNLYDTNGYVYFYKGKGYYRSEKMYVTTNHAFNLAFHVSVDNGAFVTNSRNKIVSSEETFSASSGNGTIFYVYTPIDSENTTSVTISGSYSHLNPGAWVYSSGRYGFGQKMVSMEFGSKNFNYNVYFKSQTITIPDNPTTEDSYTGTINLTKQGTGVTGYTTSTVENETLYRITSGTVGLQGATFALMDKDYNPINNKIAYKTSSEGKISLSNIPLTNFNENSDKYATLVLCEINPAEGYYISGTNEKDSDDNVIANVYSLTNSGKKTNWVYSEKSKDGKQHNYACVTVAFEKTSAKESVITRNYNQIINSPKTFKIKVNKTVSSGDKDGYKFGVYSTETITASNNSTIPAGSLVAVIETNSEGEATLDTSSYYLPANQDYLVKEFGDYEVTYTIDTNAGVDYAKEYSYWWQTKEFGPAILVKVSEQTDASKTYTIDAYNQLTGQLKIVKTGGESKTPLEGVVFNLVNETDTSKVYSGTTDSKGEVTITAPYGEYYLYENSTEKYFNIDGAITIDNNSVITIGKDLKTINIQNAEAYTGQIVVSKEIINNPNTNDEFKFIVKKCAVSKDKDNSEIKNCAKETELKINGEGNATYTYWINNVGTYYYKVYEVNGGSSNYTYDSEVYEEKLVVTKESNDKVKVEKSATKGNKSVKAEEVTFTNIFTPNPTSYTLSISKVISNKDKMTDDVKADNYTFKFNLLDNQTKNTEKLSITGESSTSKTFDYTKAGTYKYTITEQTISDFSTNIEKYNLEVEVSQQGANLVATPTITKNDETVSEVKFTNTWKIPTPTSDTIKIVKDSDAKRSNEFKFLVHKTSTLGVADQTLTIKGHESKELTFNFTNVGTYSYEISEVEYKGLTGGEEAYKGYIFDTSKYTLTYEIVRKNDKLVINSKTLTKDGKEVKLTDGEKPTMTFTNNFEVSPIKYTIWIEKEVEKLSKEDAAKFEFTFLINGQDAAYIEGNGKAGHELTFTKEGIYEYTITEQYNDAFIKNEDSYKVIITVVRENDDVLKISNVETTKNETEKVLTSTIASTKVKFVNEYDTPDNTDIIDIVKIVKGTFLKDKFEFTIDDGENVETLELTGAGTLNKEFVFNKEGTYTYTIKEVDEGYEGYTFDDSEYKLTYVVAKKGLGYNINSKTLTKDGVEVDEIKFTNTKTYKPVIGSFVLTKTWEGVEDKYASALSSEITVNNQKVSFKGNASKVMTYSFTEPGTYMYEVKEVIGTDKSITYDKNVFTVIFTVTEGENGLDVVCSRKSVDFVNKFTYDKIRVSVPINKVVNGSEPEKKEFTIQVDGEDKFVLKSSESKNYYQTYTEEGTYTFKVKEKNTGLSNYVYDNTEYSVTVKVEKSGLSLKATVSIKAGDKAVDKITFTNTYKPTVKKEEPKKPTYKVVNTGAHN